MAEATGEQPQPVSAEGPPARLRCRGKALWAIMALTALAILWPNLPRWYAPGMTGFSLLQDDYVMMRAVHRSLRGRGLATCNRLSDELSILEYSYPGTMPPGVPLILVAQSRLGLTPEAAYKNTLTLFALLGVAGWLLLGARFLGPAGLALFGAGLFLSFFG